MNLQSLFTGAFFEQTLEGDKAN